MKKFPFSLPSLKISMFILLQLILLSALIVLWSQNKQNKQLFGQQKAQILNEQKRVFDLKKTLSGGTQIQNGVEILFRIHGSNTLGDEMIPKAAEEYLNRLGALAPAQILKDSKSKERMIVFAPFFGSQFPVGIEILALGSEVAFTSLKDGQSDLGMSSRPIREKDQKALDSAGVFGVGQTGTEHVVGMDGVAVIVNSKNPIQELTREQIRDLFSGKIQDWSELGGPRLAVKPMIRDSKSGTRKFFKELILDTLEFSPNSKIKDSHHDISEEVNREEGAIGFVSLPYIGTNKALGISATSGPALIPNAFSVSTEDYLISRRLYIYHRPELKNLFAQEFLQYLLSLEGQKSVAKTGFVALDIKDDPNTQKELIAKSNLPDSYKKMSQNSVRLSINLRFKAGSSDLDEKGQRDLIRLAERLNAESNQIRHLWLLGFADSTGQTLLSEQISKERSEQVWNKLKELLHGFDADKVKTMGYGEINPIESNATPQGQAKNRRVEVWIERNSL